MVAAPVVAGLVVAAVVLSQVGTNAASLGPDVPFSDALAKSLSLAVSDLGGPWYGIGGIGLDERTSGAISTANLTTVLGANCTVTPWNATALPSTVAVPTYGGSFASGVAPFWAVLVKGSTAGAFAVANVINGSAVPLAKFSGTNCGAGPSPARVLPVGAVDSPTAAAKVWSADGSGWVSGDSGLTSLTMAAFGGGTYDGITYSDIWGFIYSACNPFLGGSTSKPGFAAIVNLTTDTVEAALPHSVDCPS